VIKARPDHELPECIARWGWKYHHMGIPTDHIMPGETYFPQFKFWTSGFSSSPFGIEWMRFDKDSPVNKLIRTVPHIAFEVDNLDYELSCHDLKILTPPNSHTKGIRVAMIEHNGAPIELIEFDKNMFRNNS
jgi:hypothetical protein